MNLVCPAYIYNSTFTQSEWLFPILIFLFVCSDTWMSPKPIDSFSTDQLLIWPNRIKHRKTNKQANKTHTKFRCPILPQICCNSVVCFTDGHQEKKKTPLQSIELGDPNQLFTYLGRSVTGSSSHLTADIWNRTEEQANYIFLFTDSRKRLKN